MVIVELKSIENRTKEAFEYLKQKTGIDWKIKGTRAEANARTQDVKLVLHKFLHQQGITDHRVLSRSGTLAVVPIEPGKPSSDIGKVKGVPPFPPVGGPGLPGLQTVYPNYPPIIRTKPPKKYRS